MTEIQEPEVIVEALKIIDRGLSEMLNRELVSTNEVADLLLDVRTLLTAPPAAPSATTSGSTDVVEDGVPA